MEIICDSCDSKFRIADEKIPEGRSASLSCPKCQNKITVNQPPAAQPTPPADSDDFDFDYDYSDHYETTDGTFDFAEDEGKTALICAVDPTIIGLVSKVMNFLEFHVTVVENARDAIKRMRYHQFDVMLVDENFDCRDPDTNGILIYLSRIHMATRREMFVVMFTERYQTLDNMTALHKSVNLIINMKNMDRFENIIKKSLSDGNMFYRVYHETRKKIGLE